MVYNVNTFIKPPSSGDKVIFIVDNNNVVRLSIDPYSSTFFHKSKYVYIMTDGRMNINNTLEFATSEDSMDAVSRLNDTKRLFMNDVLSECGLDPNYFTTGQSDARYVNIVGDTMTGDLSITPLSFMGGDLYERNTNVDSNGKIIIGNQFRIERTVQNPNDFCDKFDKTETYSCIWFYTVKNGTNLRTGQISAVWNEDGTDISYSHTTTNDVGNTETIDFVVDLDPVFSNDIRLFANVSSGVWKVRILRLFI